MFDNKLWHHALKLNKGIYKTTEHLSDAEILKKQLREQTNEILSTISVFCSRESVYPEQGRRASALPPQDSKFKIQNLKFKFHDHSLPTSASALPPQDSIRQPADKSHDYYLPESEICLLLLLDKITVLKTFLFLAKEHNFFNEEKHQILTAACVHLSDSVQSELHGADIFSHPVFNSDHSLFPSASALPPQDSKFKIQNSPPKADPPQAEKFKSHDYSASPKDETLSDILDNLSDIIHENTENISDNLSDTPNKKAENYISKSIKSRQNKSFKSYFPKFLNRPSFSAFPENGSPAENRSPKYSLPAPSVIASPAAAGDEAISPSASPKNTSIAIEESPQFDFLAIYSAPLIPPSSSLRGVPPRRGDEAISAPNRFHLTPRQQKLHDFIVAKSASSPSASALPPQDSKFKIQNSKFKSHDHSLPASASNVKIGDLTPLFPEKISEKTIRRDLQVLINNSLIAQSGSRRWTCYSVV